MGQVFLSVLSASFVYFYCACVCMCVCVCLYFVLFSLFTTRGDEVFFLFSLHVLVIMVHKSCVL